MFLAAILLLTLGVMVSLLGLKLFRILLPIAGLVVGFMVGFGGFQAIAGTGAVSTAIAVLVALIVGVLMALLSFVFFDFAVLVFSAVIGASALSFLGIALGLNEQGFLVFMLSVAGAIIGFVFAAAYPVPLTLVVVVTSMLGVAMMMASALLIVGEVSLDQLHNQGIIPTIVKVVDQSFLWLVAWVGGSLLAINFQKRLLLLEVLGSSYQYPAVKSKK